MNTEAKQYNRLPIQCARALNGNEYKIMDYLLYRNALDGWRFSVGNIANETGTSKDTVWSALRKFLENKWVTQDDKGHYHFVYNKVEKWIVDIITEAKTNVRKTNDKLGKRTTIVRKTNIQ